MESENKHLEEFIQHIVNDDYAAANTSIERAVEVKLKNSVRQELEKESE